MRSSVMKTLVMGAVVSGVGGACLVALAQGEGAGRERAGGVPDIRSTPVAGFVGRWEGTATHASPGGGEPRVVEMVERGEWKMGGTALLIEGRGTLEDPETGAEEVVHDALGLIRFDPRTEKLMFHAFKTGERAVETEMEVIGGGELRWFMRPGAGRVVRFTIKLDGETWSEVGEFSGDDGETYHRFLEMELERVG